MPRECGEKSYGSAERQRYFLSALRDQGNRAGNVTLQRELRWEEPKYWKIHEQLFKEGLIERKKGYGGVVILAQQAASPVTTAVEHLDNDLSPRQPSTPYRKQSLRL